MKYNHEEFNVCVLCDDGVQDSCVDMVCFVSTRLEIAPQLFSAEF